MAYGNGNTIYSGSGTANVGVITVPDQVRPVIGRELEEQEKKLALLHETINVLEQRLQVVCTPQGPSTAGQSTSAAPVSASAVINGLRNAGYQLDAAISRVQELINRLEV